MSRIGVIGLMGPDYFAENVGDALQRLGHEVTQLGAAHPRGHSRLVDRAAGLARQALPHLDERAQDRIVRAALAADCEIIINVDSFLVPNAVTRLRSSGARVAFWFPDAVSNLGRQLMLLAPYDAIFFKEPFLIDRLRSMLDLPVYYLPQACNPRWHRPVTPAGTESCLVIAGNMYPSRVRLLDRLIAEGIPLRLYGGDSPAGSVRGGPGRAYGPLCHPRGEGQGLPVGRGRAEHHAPGRGERSQPTPVRGGRLRRRGAHRVRPTVPELFAVGKEMLVFHDFDNLVEQATRLLSEPGLTARLGDAAASEPGDHTYDLRVTAILKQLS